MMDPRHCAWKVTEQDSSDTVSLSNISTGPSLVSLDNVSNFPSDHQHDLKEHGCQEHHAACHTHARAHNVQHASLGHGHVGDGNARTDMLHKLEDIVHTDGVCPQTLEHFVQHLDVFVAGSPIQRLHSWLLLQRRTHSAVSTSEASPSVGLKFQTPSLPSHLPPYPYKHKAESQSSDLVVSSKVAWNVVPSLVVNIFSV